MVIRHVDFTRSHVSSRVHCSGVGGEGGGSGVKMRIEVRGTGVGEVWFTRFPSSYRSGSLNNLYMREFRVSLENLLLDVQCPGVH